jgi:hypothetical protein
MPHSEELPAPERPESWYLQDDAEMASDDREMHVYDMDCYTRICTTAFRKKTFNDPSRIKYVLHET